MGLTGSVLRRAEVDDAMTLGLFRLYAAHYAPTSLAVFARDLAKKDYSIILRDTTGRVCGFSTVARFPVPTAAGEVEVLFSGDTVVEREHWGEQALPFTWIREAGRIKAQAPDRPLYWLLITKGHRTFRYLPGFAQSFCPGPDPDLRVLRDQIAGHAFGPRFDARTGLLHPDPACPAALRPEFAGLDAGRLGNPHVQAFLALNPRHAQGEELVCLCELGVDNLRMRARQQFLQGMA